MVSMVAGGSEERSHRPQAQSTQVLPSGPDYTPRVWLKAILGHSCKGAGSCPGCWDAESHIQSLSCPGSQTSAVLSILPLLPHSDVEPHGYLGILDL